MRGSVADGFRTTDRIDENFAAELDEADPLPDDCISEDEFAPLDCEV